MGKDAIGIGNTLHIQHVVRPKTHVVRPKTISGEQVMSNDDDVVRRAKELFDRACTSKERGQIDKAADLLEEALALVSTRLGEDNELYADLLTGVTRVYFENLKNKQPATSIAYSKKFLQVQTQNCGLPVEEPSSLMDQAWKIYDLGRFFQWCRDHAKADCCFLQSLILASEPGYTDQMDIRLGCLGFNRSAEENMISNDMQMAEHNCTVAMNSSKHLGDSTIELITNTNIATLCLLAGNSSSAKMFYQQAMSLCVKGGSNSSATVIDSADSYLKLVLIAKEFRAEKDAQRLVDLAGQIVSSEGADKPLYAPLLERVASHLLEYNYYARAGELYEKVFQQGSTPGLRQTGLLGMGDSSAGQGNWAKAEETFETALKLANSIGPEFEAFALNQYANTLKSGKRRLLEAANMEARAKVLAQSTK